MQEILLASVQFNGPVQFSGCCNARSIGWITRWHKAGSSEGILEVNFGEWSSVQGWFLAVYDESGCAIHGVINGWIDRH